GAEEWLRRMLQVDPTDTEAQYNLVSALQAQGRREEAAAVMAEYEKSKALLERANKLLKEEVDRPTNDPGAASEVGTLLLRLGQKRLGLYWLNQALERDPRHRPTHKAPADYPQHQGDQHKAA